MSFRVSTRNDNQIFTTKIFFNQQRSADFNWHSKKTNWTECQYVIFALCLLERKLTIFISIFTIYFIQRYRVCVMITACSAAPLKKKKKKTNLYITVEALSCIYISDGASQGVWQGVWWKRSHAKGDSPAFLSTEAPVKSVAQRHLASLIGGFDSSFPDTETGDTCSAE